MAKGQIARTEIKSIQGKSMKSSKTAGIKNNKSEAELKQAALKNANAKHLKGAKKAKDVQQNNLNEQAQKYALA